MHQTTKLLVGTAVLTSTVMVVSALKSRVQLAEPAVVQTRILDQPTPVPGAAAPRPETVAGKPKPAVVTNDETVVPPLPANATHVPDADLLKLSALVNLPNAEERHIDKGQWSRAVPIARQLAQGPCDCEQRNWLTHFIEMGDAALAGSTDDYYKLAGLMRKMARNDRQLTDDPAFFAR